MTLFDLMDDFSLLNIFDFLEFGDLANIATLGHRYEQLIAEHYFTAKYGLVGSSVDILLSNFDKQTYARYHTPKNSQNSPKLRTIGYDQLLSVLKVFCSQFSHLNIVTNYVFNDIHLTQKVAKTINDYCANTPQTMKMDLPSNTLNLNFSFNNATDININFPVFPAYNGREIDQIFPRMESLSIDICSGYNLNHHFSHLKRVSVRENNNGQFNWKAFAKRNPQIDSVKTKFDWDVDYLEQINQIFPKLESLHIELKVRKDGDNNGLVGKMSKWWTSRFKAVPIESVQFKGVKEFTLDIRYYHNDRLMNGNSSIQFNQLESFTLITRSDRFVGEAIELMVQNRGLLRVDCSSHLLSADQIVRLATELPRLNEIALKCTRVTQAANILAVFNGTSVETVILSFGRTLEETDSGILSSLDGWKLQYRTDLTKSLVFKRV